MILLCWFIQFFLVYTNPPFPSLFIYYNQRWDPSTIRYWVYKTSIKQLFHSILTISLNARLILLWGWQSDRHPSLIYILWVHNVGLNPFISPKSHAKAFPCFWRISINYFIYLEGNLWLTWRLLPFDNSTVVVRSTIAAQEIELVSSSHGKS